MYIRLGAMGFFVSIWILSAQQNGHRQKYPRSGDTVVELMPVSEPNSLEQLIRMSALIVDGTVVSTLPPISTTHDPTEPVVETHSIVSVRTVLKGAVPGNSPRILLAQFGGRAGYWNVTAAGDPLIAVNERYIFFLADDTRKEAPSISGLPRYGAVGVWSGKVKVAGGKIVFRQRAYAGLHKYDNTDVNDFTQKIKEILTNPVIPTSNLPIHPGPPL